MPAIVVVGMQWGDEGKGKIVDFLAREADLVVRHQGGNNAGHTVFINGQRFVLHLLPTGTLQNKVCAIGSGVVINPEVLWNEITELRTHGYAIEPGKLVLSPNSHVIFPYHILLDTAKEKMRGKSAIGTTSRGIGPAYRDKIERSGIRLGELCCDPNVSEHLARQVESVNRLLTKLYDHPPVQLEEIEALYRPLAENLKPFLGDVPATINKVASQNGKVLFEGAQGTLLDIDTGTYPYVTSSNTGSGGACTGSGFPPHCMDGCLGIVKAYTTRVGSGPFPTELDEEMADLVRNAGPVGEFGATTGRPRRCGWFDAPLVKRAVMVNGAYQLALTRLDVLSEFEEIPVATHYMIGQEKVDLAPEDLTALADCQPVYEKMPGWKTDLTGIRRYEDLPAAAQAYVARLEELVGAQAILISVGPDREQTIVRTPDLFHAVHRP